MAKKTFQPYREIKDANEEARDGIKQLLARSCFTRTRKRYIYVNNRLEGSAPWTIAAVLASLAAERAGLASPAPDNVKLVSTDELTRI